MYSGTFWTLWKVQWHILNIVECTVAHSEHCGMYSGTFRTLWNVQWHILNIVECTMAHSEHCGMYSGTFWTLWNVQWHILNILECTVAHSKMLSIPGVGTCWHVCTQVLPGESSEIFATEILGLFVIPYVCVCVCVCVWLWEQQTTSVSRLEVFHRTLLRGWDYRDVTLCIPTYQQSSASILKTWRSSHHLLLVGHSVLAFTDGTNRPYVSPHCVAFPMCIAANCSWSIVCCVIILCVSLLPYVYCFSVCIAVLHTSVARLLARSQNTEGPATGKLGTGFSWFPCVYKQMLLM
jgi:hypothetical protein